MPARMPTHRPESAAVRASAARPVAARCWTRSSTGSGCCTPARQPLSVDGRQLGHGLPRRRIPLPELSAILMHPSCDFAARDDVWRLLVTRARTGDAKWVVGAVGVALPGLRTRRRTGWPAPYSGDVQAALVTEFVAALSTVGLDRAEGGVPAAGRRLVGGPRGAARHRAGHLRARRTSRPARRCRRRRTGTRTWCSPAPSRPG